MVNPPPSADVFGVVGQTLLGKYRVLRVVGQGGQAVVYEAEQLGLKRRVAIKFLQAAAEPDQATALARFQQEAEILASLSHPAIVHVYEIATHGKDLTPLMVMEFVRGQPLARRLQYRRRTPWHEAFELAAQAASALAATHARNIIHRDIKPDNLMVAESGMLKVLDFGIAKLVSDLSLHGGERRNQRLTAVNQVVGTFAYMSPEQFEPDVALDGRSDVYSLGVVLYRLLSAKPIWPTNNLHEIVNLLKTSKPVDIQKHVPDLPDHAAELVRRALEADRTQRFQSMEEMQQALVSSGQRWGKDDDDSPTKRVYAPGADTIVDDLGPPVGATAAPASIGRRAKSSRLRTALIAACAVLLAATLVAWRIAARR